MNTKYSILGLACSLTLTFLAAGFGSRYMPGEWYAQLQKPSWNPPSWIFAPAWTLLYIMMAVAAWRVWRVAGFDAARGALVLFLVQLALNGTWSWIFFGLKNPALAVADIVALWLAIAATLVAFWSHSRLAGCLLLPYLAWVTFASALNIALWRMNPRAS